MRRPTAALLLAASLAVAACGGSADEADVAADTTPDRAVTTNGGVAAPPADAGAAPEVPDELDFVAPDVRGGQVVGAELAGQDLVIWFWAPW